MGRKRGIDRIMEKNIFWYVAIYVRLSKEDGRDESNSVTNQRQMLLQALQKLKQRYPNEKYELVDIYIDDGKTGTDTNREGLQRMRAAIKAKKVNMVMVKDLSRLGRNYANAGEFIDEFFVKYDVRFISLLEPPIDSYLNPDSIDSMMVAIHNVFNDAFARTTSNKIRSVFEAKKLDGKFIGAFAPYGYQKNPEDKGSFIIDKEAAAVVKDIFHWFVNDGMTKIAIAKKLNDFGIPSPAAYKKIKGFKYQNPSLTYNQGKWTDKTVFTILINQMYLGHMVQGRQKVKSYKIHDKVDLPESDWIIVKNTHKPIIHEDLFYKAQSRHKRDTRAAPGAARVHIFSGYLRCFDCMKCLHRKTNSKGGASYFYCRSYTTDACTKRSIKEEIIYCIILKYLQTHIAAVCELQEILAEINQQPILLNKSGKIVKQLKDKKHELLRIRSLRDDLYIDMKKGFISEEQYPNLKKRHDREEKELLEVIKRLEAEEKLLSNGMITDNSYLETFIKYGNIQKLTRETVVDLIENIYLEGDGKVTIEFRFDDDFKKWWIS